MAKKRRLNPEEKRRREFKIRFKPLFDEFYHLSSVEQVDESLGPQEQAEHPRCFLQIKAKFQKLIYENVKQIVDDMRRITRGIPPGETTVSKAARELELYIERTIEPIERAEDILELYQLERGTCIELDSNDSLGSEGSLLSKQFYHSSDMDRMKMSLRWPLPAVSHKTNESLIASSNIARQSTGLRSAPELSIPEESTPTTREGTMSAPRLPIPEESTGEETTSHKTFMIEGTIYKVAVTPLRQMLQFSICVLPENEVDRLSFVSEYVDRFLKSKPIRNIKLGPSELSQRVQDSAINESAITRLFDVSLHLPIRRLVLNSLDAHNGTFSLNFNTIIEDRPYVFAPAVQGGIHLEAAFSLDQVQPKFFGLSFKPDFTIEYDANVIIGSKPRVKPTTMPVIFTGIGELKYITFELGECIKDLKVRRRTRGHDELPDVAQKQRSRIKEVENTLCKYTSHCVHLGLPRFALSDYNGYFLARLEFILNPAPSGYGTGKAEIEGVEGDEGIMFSGKYIKVHYSYFARNDPYIKLYFAAFFAMSESYVEEIQRFRTLVKKKFEKLTRFIEFQQQQQRAYEQQQQRANQSADGTGGTAGGTDDTAPGTGGQTGQGSDQAGDRNRRAEEYNLRSTSIFNENSNDTNGIFTPPTSSPRPTPSYHPDVMPLGKESKHGVSQVNSGSQSNRPLAFDKSLFKDPSYVELGNVITDFIAVGPRIAQVVQVQTRNCQRQLFPENMIGDSDLPEKCVMKVYDPYHGVLTEHNAIEGELHSIHYSYQLGIDYTIAEVKVYCALRGCGFTPRLIAYGRISDLYPAVGELYLALCGGYLMLEQLDDDEHFVINKDFYKGKIVPVYRALHLFNILHGDVKRQNVCITEGNFMLIDFSHASFSSDQRKKDAEMLVVEKTFSRVEWG